MAALAAASTSTAPAADLLDIQSLPSLEKFDSQILDLIKASSDAGAAGINVMDELQAPDDDLALQRLMSLTRNRSHDAFNTLMAAQQQHNDEASGSAAAAAAAAAVGAAGADDDQQDVKRAIGANQLLRGQLHHHQLPTSAGAAAASAAAAAGAGPERMTAVVEYMQQQQHQQQQQAEGASQAQLEAQYASVFAAQHMAQLVAQDHQHAQAAMVQGGFADALAGLQQQNPGGLSALMESLRGASHSDGQLAAAAATAAAAAAGYHPLMGGGGHINYAALAGLGLPDADGPVSAGAQRKRANRGTRLTDIIKSIEEAECGFAGHESLSAAAAAMAAALQGTGGGGGGGSDSRDSTQSPHKRRKGNAAAAAAAAMASADSDYEMEMHSTSHLHITPDMDEETKTRLRREKNKIAARKCRAKKNALMTDLQGTLSTLMRKNDAYKAQLANFGRMFNYEKHMRDQLKALITMMWSNDVPPAATGYTASDIINCIESGTLDTNSLLRSFAAVSAAHANGGATPTAAQAAAAAAVAAASSGLASPTPLVLHHSTSAANTPRSPAAAAAAAAAAEAAMAAAVAADGGIPVQGLVPQHLLMSHLSHQGSHIPNTPHTPQAMNEVAASMGMNMGMGMHMNMNMNSSMVLNAAAAAAAAGGGKGMMGGGDGNTLGSPIPSVAASALVDLAGGVTGASMQGFGSLDAQWGWGVEGGLSTARSQVGPSCITTGME